MDRSDFEKKLTTLSREEMEDLLLNLYDNNQTVMQGLNLLYDEEANEEKIVKEYKGRLSRQIAFVPYDYYDPDEDLSTAVQTVDELQDIVLGRPKPYGEILIHAIEEALDRMSEGEDLPYEFYENLMEFIRRLRIVVDEEPELFEHWKKRIDHMMNYGDWDADNISEVFDEEFGSFFEEEEEDY